MSRQYNKTEKRGRAVRRLKRITAKINALKGAKKGKATK
jgi:hypothetical protein